MAPLKDDSRNKLFWLAGSWRACRYYVSLFDKQTKYHMVLWYTMSIAATA